MFYFCQREVCMKILGNILIIVFFISGLLIARTDKDVKKVDSRQKNQYYWMKGHAEDQNQLERKRSHKRRRKMKKPVKGLR